MEIPPNPSPASQRELTIPTNLSQATPPPGQDNALLEQEQHFLQKMQDQLLAQERLRTQALQELYNDRKKYGNRIYWLIVIWLVGIGCCILLQGISPSFPGLSFSLADSVLIALIGGTTATVVGLFMVVVRSIFNISEPREKPK